MNNDISMPAAAGLVLGIAFVIVFASGSGYVYPSTKLSSPYYDSADSREGESALLLINRCIPPVTSSRTDSETPPSIMERTWISVSKLNVQPYQVGNTSCILVSSDLLSSIPKLAEALKGADGCASGTEICAVSYGMSSAALYPNGIAVDDSQDYELSLAKEEAEILADTVVLPNNLAILAHNDTFYLLAFYTTNSIDMGAQVESQLEESVTWEPVRLWQGETLDFTLKIRTFATYGGPVDISLEAYPTARDSGLVVKLEPSELSMNERSEVEVKLIIEAPSDNYGIMPKEGIYETYITGRISNSSVLHSPCGLGGQCPVIQLGDSKWTIRTYGNDVGLGMGGKDPYGWLAAEVATEKQVYEEDDNVVLKAYVVNHGNETATLDDVRMFLQVFDRERKSGYSSVYAFDAILNGPITIEPNSRTLLARGFEWDQKTFGSGMDPHSVHTGIYGIDLLFSGYEGIVFHDHKEIQIVGRGQQQNPGNIDGQTTNSNNTTSPIGSYKNATAIVIPKGASETAENEILYFQPQVAYLQGGSKFYWKNEDYLPHTATSSTPDSEDAGQLFDTMIIPARQQSDLFMLDRLGQYPYFCALHPWMSGMIVVQGP